jgi:hypothetical protein
VPVDLARAFVPSAILLATSPTSNPSVVAFPVMPIATLLTVLKLIY